MTDSGQEAVKCRKCGGADFKIYEDGSGFCMTCNDAFVGVNRYGKIPEEVPRQSVAEQGAEQVAPPPPAKKFPARKVVAIALAILLMALPLTYFAINRDGGHSLITIYEVSDLRGLDVLYEPPQRFISGDDYTEMLNEMAIGVDMQNQTRVLYSLFLLEPEDDLMEMYLSSMTDGVLGYYDPNAKEIVIIKRGDEPDVMLKMTLAHEYTHALQDQHFDLGSAHLNERGWDQSLAGESLIEGDATFSMYKYLETLSSDEISLLFEYVLSQDSGEYNYAMEQLLAFPYIHGMRFVNTLHYTSGWSRVDSAYLDPPSTTEQIMHPEKYLMGEGAIEVHLNVQVPGMTLCVNETLGEFMVFTMLDFRLPTVMSEIAAGGWGGDRFHYYSEGEDFLCVWKIVWDTEVDCREFASAFDEMVGALPVGYRSEFTDGRAGLITDGASAILYRANDAAIIDSVLPQLTG